MSLAVVTTLSLLETVAVVPLGDVLRVRGIVALVSFLVAQYIAIQIYKIFIWPFYISPLRHLPTPKVTTAILVVSYKDPKV